MAKPTSALRFLRLNIFRFHRVLIDNERCLDRDNLLRHLLEVGLPLESSTLANTSMLLLTHRLQHLSRILIIKIGQRRIWFLDGITCCALCLLWQSDYIIFSRHVIRWIVVHNWRLISYVCRRSRRLLLATALISGARVSHQAYVEIDGILSLDNQGTVRIVIIVIICWLPFVI